MECYSMDTVNATTLKNRLGSVLERAALGRVAIERHGRVVAYLVPAHPRKARTHAVRSGQTWDRMAEERAVELATGGDFRPSRWLRAGDAKNLAGICMILASHEAFKRSRMMALAERLCPGMPTPRMFGRWLKTAPVHAERFVRLVDARSLERAIVTKETAGKGRSG
ncbi:MAG: type II toxin-antitoxin system Phd/YefM family antitoxin [Casimicrobiaceae bacterium]